MPEKFSYSKLECYENCPYKFKLQYIDKIFCDSSNINTAWGTLVHHTYEVIANSIMANNPIDYDMLKSEFQILNLPKTSAFDRSGDLFGTDVLQKRYEKQWFTTDKTGRTFEDKKNEFLESGIYRLEQYMNEHPELEIVCAEVPFEYHYKDLLFRGFIDRLLRYKDDPFHFVIHDIKTASQVYDDKKLNTPLQMYIYMQAMRERYPDQEVICDCVYDFPMANSYAHAGSRGWENRCAKKIEKLLSGINEKDYTAYSSPLCFWCQFSNSNPEQPPEGHNKCPYYSLWTPENRIFTTKLPWLGIENDEEQVAKLVALDALENSDDFDLEI